MFWKNRPLNSEGDITPLKCEDIGYDYKIFYDGDSSSLFVEFINANYSTQNLTYVYDKPTMDYFLRGGFWIAIHSKKFPEKIIGVVAGNKININKHGECMEIDFLCVINQVRNLGVAAFLINKATEICSVKYKMYSALFTGHKNIGDLFFCTKNVYHRPLELKKLIECRTINIKDEDVDVYDKYFKVFNSSKDFTCTTQVDYTMINKMEKQDVIRREYKFKNEECFIDFTITDKIQNTTDFFRFYKLDIKNKKTGFIVKNIMLYDYVLKNYKPDRFFTVLERVCEHLHVNNLCDQVSFYKPFGDVEEGKYTVGKSPLYYYMFNKRIDTINVEDIQFTPL